MIHDRLIPALKREFARWDIQYDVPPRPIAVFPAAPHPAVGRVLVYDNGGDAMVIVENITHGHFEPWDDEPSKTETESDEVIANMVVDFLRDLFNDRVLLYTYDKGGAGWTDLQDEQVTSSPAYRCFLWSRPTSDDDKG